MSITRFFIVRHGETDFNKKHMMQGRGLDAPLNETGKKQALQIATELERVSADKVVASSLMRSIQTAQPLAKLQSLPILSYDELDEMNFGDYEGKKSADIQSDLDRIHNEWAFGNTSLSIPGGESPIEVFKRADRRVQELLLNHDSQTIIMVLHGRLIRILLSEWLGHGLKNMHKIEHSNGAIYHVVKNGDIFKKIYLNKIDHLKD